MKKKNQAVRRSATTVGLGLLCYLTACPPVLAAVQCPDGTPPPCTRPVARPGAAPPATSVAVLYFDNLSRDTADAYVADGLTEELIARLGQIERLQVKSRTAVQRYRGRPIDDPTSLGRTLGVAHLVSGSVRRGGGRLRVTVEMMRASTGVRVWGNTYERGAADLMAVEADIAQAIAEGVGGQLAPAERRSLVARPTTDPAAYDRMLRGNFYLAQRTGPAVRRAIAEYEAAVRIDVALAPVWARIGLAYYLFLDWGWPWPGVPGDTMLARGFAAADRALALDSANSDAWMARGLLLSLRNPATFEGAVPALERATRLDPRNAEAWHQLGGVLHTTLRLPESRVAYGRALALDPVRMITLANLGLGLRLQGRNAEALQVLDSAIAAIPDAYYLRVVRGLVRLDLRDVAGARADADTAERLRSADFVIDSEPLLIAVAAAEGDSAGARVRAERLAGQIAVSGPLEYGPAWYLAQAFFASGQSDRTLTTLERARGTGLNLRWVMADPMFAPLRGTPRFERLLAEVQPPWAR